MFTTDDIFKLRFDKSSNSAVLNFYKLESAIYKKVYQITIPQSINENDLCFCVNLCGEGDQVEIINKKY